MLQSGCRADAMQVQMCREYHGADMEVLQWCCRGAVEVLQRFRGKGGADMEVLICLCVGIVQVQVIFVRLQVIVQVQRRCRGGAQLDGAEVQVQ